MPDRNSSYFLADIQIRRHVKLIGDIFAVLLALPDAFGQEILNLAVYGAEIILCPGCDCVIQLLGKPQRDLFFWIVCHRRLIEAPGVYYWLCVMVPAEYHQ